MREAAIWLAIWVGCALMAVFVIPYVIVMPALGIWLILAAPWPTIPAVVLALGQLALYQQTRPSPY
jgi:hypothetical protein